MWRPWTWLWPEPFVASSHGRKWMSRYLQSKQNAGMPCFITHFEKESPPPRKTLSTSILWTYITTSLRLHTHGSEAVEVLQALQKGQAIFKPQKEVPFAMLQSHAQTQSLKSNSHYFSLHLIVWVSPLEAFPASFLTLTRCLQNLDVWRSQGWYSRD